MVTHNDMSSELTSAEKQTELFFTFSTANRQAYMTNTCHTCTAVSKVSLNELVYTTFA